MERNMSETVEQNLQRLRDLVTEIAAGGGFNASISREASRLTLELFEAGRIGFGAPDTGHQLIYATEVICPRCSAAPGDNCTQVTTRGRVQKDTACGERVDLLHVFRRDLGLTQ